MKTQLILIPLCMMLLTFPLKCQEDQGVAFNYDMALNAAIEYARQGNYDESRILCRRILRDKPEYNDARLLLGNTYAWENDFGEARRIYHEIFDYDHANKSAIVALANLEIWDQNPAAAIEVCESGLGYYPDDQDLLLLHARSSALSGNMSAAKKSLYGILIQDRNNEEARQLYFKIRDAVPYAESSYSSTGQSTVYSLISLDSLMVRAKNHAWNEEYGIARQITGQILQRKPDYYPAILLNAYTYAWGNDFVNARQELKRFDPFSLKDRDGIIAYIDIEKWARNYDQALLYCNAARRLFPDDDEFILKTSEIFALKNDFLQAKRILYNRLLQGKYTPEMLIAYNQLINQSSENEKLRLERQMNDSLYRNMDIEGMMSEAQTLAFNGNYNDALEQCEEILDVYPDYYAANFLKGNILSWQENYDEALIIYESLFTKAFDSYELIAAMVDVYTWVANYDKALEMVQYGLGLYPNDTEFLYKRALIYQRTGQTDLANREMNNLIQINPDDRRIREAYYSLKGPLPITGISGEYTYNGFKLPFARLWKMYTARYYHSNDLGTFIGSVNMGYVDDGTTTFMQNGGVQFEFDAWPVFPEKKSYFHLNVGYSPSAVFAKYRLGAHAFYELTDSWEISGGFNYMYFKSAIDTTYVFMVDGGIARFFKSYMAGFNANFAPVDGKISQGYTFYLRRFFNMADNWVQLSLGTGIFPDNPVYYLNDPTYMPTRMLSSLNVLLAARYHFARRWIGRIYAGVQFEEYKANVTRRNTTLNLGLIYLLRDF